MHDDVPDACRLPHRHNCARNSLGEWCPARLDGWNVWSRGIGFDSLAEAVEITDLFNGAGRPDWRSFLNNLTRSVLYAVVLGGKCIMFASPQAKDCIQIASTLDIQPRAT